MACNKLTVMFVQCDHNVQMAILPNVMTGGRIELEITDALNKIPFNKILPAVYERPVHGVTRYSVM